MKKVSAHKLKNSYTEQEADEDLTFVRTELAAKLGRHPVFMGGKQVGAQITSACWAHSLGRSKDALEEFSASADCAGAVFAAIAAEPNTDVAFAFRGQTLTGPSGPPGYGCLPPDWMRALFLCLALRRADVVDTMLAVPPATLQSAPGESDDCFVKLVHALQAFFLNRAFVPHLEEFERLSRPEALKISTPQSIERFRALDPILRAIADRNQARLDAALVTELEAHKKVFSKGQEAKGVGGIIDVLAAGSMRVALDRGLVLGVESDYVPKWLIGVEAP